VVSNTVPVAKDPRVVPVGRVTEMVLPAAPSRSPEDEVTNPIVQVVRAPTADDEGFTVGEATDLAAAIVVEAEAEADLVSELVDTDTVAGPVAVGLVTPFRVTVTASPAGTE
jgi:predicted neutral ceramidase superfamily lipid hydrolase